jgi:hypothetical protein
MTALHDLLKSFRGEADRPAVEIVVRCVGPDGYYTGAEIRHTPEGRVKTFNPALAGTRCPSATTPERTA